MSRRSRSQARTIVYADGVIKRGGTPATRWIYGEQIIISRGLCHYERMTKLASGLSLRAIQAVRLSANARTPAPDPGFHFDDRGQELGVWSWDKSILDPLGDFDGQVIPESLLHDPLDQGTRLIACIDGVEGQIWQNGQLKHSRWWPNAPSPSDWALFLRAARYEGTSDMPETTQLEFLPTPPRSNLFERALQFDGLHWRDIAAIIVFLLLVPSLYLGGQWVSLSFEHNRLSRQLAELSEASAPLVEAQRSVQATSAELAAYSQELNYVHPGQLMAALIGIADAQSIFLEEFDLREGTITAVLNAEDNEAFSPSDLVTALEANQEFQDVSVEPGRGSGRWQITAQIQRV